MGTQNHDHLIPMNVGQYTRRRIWWIRTSADLYLEGEERSITNNKLSWDCFLDLQFGILLLCFNMMSSFWPVVVYQQKVNVRSHGYLNKTFLCALTILWLVFFLFQIFFSIRYLLLVWTRLFTRWEWIHCWRFRIWVGIALTKWSRS